MHSVYGQASNKADASNLNQTISDFQPTVSKCLGYESFDEPGQHLSKGNLYVCIYVHMSSDPKALVGDFYKSGHCMYIYGFAKVSQ